MSEAVRPDVVDAIATAMHRRLPREVVRAIEREWEATPDEFLAAVRLTTMGSQVNAAIRDAQHLELRELAEEGDALWVEADRIIREHGVLSPEFEAHKPLLDQFAARQRQAIDDAARLRGEAPRER